MPLGKEMRELSADRAANDPGYRQALLCEALQAVAEGDSAVAKGLLRDLVRSGSGYERLSEQMGSPRESVSRMLSERGNPTLENFGKIVSALREAEGVRLEVTAT